MLKRDELSDANSCLNRADDREPLFVLRANDENAPAIVTEWCREYVVSKGGWAKLTPEQQKKYAEAMDIAGHMRIWKMQQNKRRQS
jgi:hypothetical protein